MTNKYSIRQDVFNFQINYPTAVPKREKLLFTILFPLPNTEIILISVCFQDLAVSTNDTRLNPVNNQINYITILDDPYLWLLHCLLPKCQHCLFMGCNHKNYTARRLSLREIFIIALIGYYLDTK